MFSSYTFLQNTNTPMSTGPFVPTVTDREKEICFLYITFKDELVAVFSLLSQVPV